MASAYMVVDQDGDIYGPFDQRDAALAFGELLSYQEDCLSCDIVVVSIPDGE